MARGEVDVFVGMGGNFLAAAPDTDATAAALARTKLTVQVSTKLNRSHRHRWRGVAHPAVPRPHRDRPDRRAACSG